MVSDEKLITALLTAPNIRAASKICGLSESAVYSRMRKPKFRAMYNDRRTHLMEESYNVLLQHLHSAVNTMGSLAATAQNEQTRLNAAEAIIRCGLRLNEQLDIMRRLEALEGNE